MSLEPFVNVTKGPSADGSKYRCPCCGYRTLTERGAYEMCPVCWWEDDGQDDHDADEVRGGPNGELSLTKARQHFRQCRASSPRHASSVRPPRPEEIS